MHVKRKEPEHFLVPCYDIDIAWHTHQVKKGNYISRAMIITGDINLLEGVPL